MTAIIDVGMRTVEGTLLPVAADRWFAVPEPADLDVLDEARAPVLDIGCGPGRHVTELASRGLSALGIDITDRALDIARLRGAPVLQRSVFERVPGIGRWRTALLLDGNIGIGGDPETLLRRVREILAHDGIALVELAPPGSRPGVRRVCLEIAGEGGPVFGWSQLPVNDVESVAGAAGFRVGRSWCIGSRSFARLDRVPISGAPR